MKGMAVWVTRKDERVCENCKYFYQHYIKTERGFKETFAGHCFYPRMKEREATDSCKYFEQKNKMSLSVR